MISKISFNAPKISFGNASEAPVNTVKTLERSPQSDTVNFSGKCSCPVCNEGELPQELKDIFDNKTFTFKKADGSEFEGTIKEYLEDSILYWDKDRMQYAGGLIHNTYFENAKEMIENGLDYSKNYRVQAGPGTYFAAFQDLRYGKIAVEGSYSGPQKEMPVFERRFYDGIMDNNEIKETAAKYVNENAPSDKTYKLVNKYCHDVLVNELGIDILYCAMGAESCFVALNDDTMSLRAYNFKFNKDGGFGGYN